MILASGLLFWTTR